MSIVFMQPEMRGIDAGIDWGNLYKKLCVFSRLCWAFIPDICDGVSAEDLPNEVLTMFFDSPNGLGWNQTKGPLDRFLLGVLKNKIREHSRRQRFIAGSFDDVEFAFAITQQHNLFAVPAFNRYGCCEQILDKFEGQRSLYEFVEASLETGDGHNINQQIAAELGTTPEDIVNRKKRLKRCLKKMDLSSKKIWEL